MVQSAIKQCVLDMSMDSVEALHGAELQEPLTEAQRAHILVLRGLLGCDMLAHALQKRHGVDYGINRYQKP